MHRSDLSPFQHDHSFGMEHRRPAERRTLIVVVLTLVTMVVEITAGLAFGSMALLADGIHMASHAAALGISVIVYVLARRLAGDHRLAFGSGKLNALGGYSSALLLGVVAIGMFYESANRLVAPVPIRYDLAILVAVVGLAVNGLSILLLNVSGGHDHDHEGGDHHDDHNLRSAFFHVLADALTSVLAVSALVVGKYMGAPWLDPLIGIVGAIVVLWWAVGLLRASSGVLLDRQGPASLREEIRRRVEAIADSRVADLHLWSVGPGLFAAELVIVADEPALAGTYRHQLDGLGLAHVVIETRPCAGLAG